MIRSCGGFQTFRVVIQLLQEQVGVVGEIPAMQDFKVDPVKFSPQIEQSLHACRNIVVVFHFPS